MDIVFLCPPAGVINGGTRFLYRMASLLAGAGHKVQMFEQHGQRPTWFSTDLPVVGQGHFQPNPGQIFVLPEDQPQILASVKDWPQKKVIYSQNHFYSSLGVGEASSYADYGVTHILCCSQAVLSHAMQRHPAVAAHLVPCSIDRALFKPLAKQKRIAYMPRKRPLEAAYIRDMFRFLFPQFRDWDWMAIHDKSETETARLIGESAVFLSLSRLEGFGLTPLEAMSAGCVVAGFTGIGGWEYATDANGFWADEDDFPVCIDQVRRAVELSCGGDETALAVYHKACEETLVPYTAEAFKQATFEAWKKIEA